MIIFFVGVQNHPRRDEMGQIKYDPVTSKLNSNTSSTFKVSGGQIYFERGVYHNYLVYLH